MKNIKSKGIPLTSQELKVFWNSYAEHYHKNVERNFISVYVNLCNLTKIYRKKNILELSCGSGEGLKYLTTNLENKINLFASDISDNVLEQTHKNFKTTNNNISPLLKTNIYKSDSDKQKLKQKLNKLHEENNRDLLKEINLNLIQIDNEDLNLFNSNSFDTVISNFSLNLVNKTEKMLSESARVLNKEGVAAFSIWGRPENSLPFTIIPNALKKMEVDLPKIRSFFHISKVELLRDMVLSNGFSKFSYCYQFVPFNIFNFKDFLFMLKSPAYLPIIEKLSESDKNKLISIIEEEFEKVLKRNELFGTEAIILLCQK